MAYLYEMVDRLNEIADELIEDAELLPADKFDLDERCGKLYIGDDFVAVPLHRDRSLQYYGGFEYVDADCRQIIGNFVFYSADDDRVAEAMDAVRGFTKDEDEVEMEDEMKEEYSSL